MGRCALGVDAAKWTGVIANIVAAQDSVIMIVVKIHVVVYIQRIMLFVTLAKAKVDGCTVRAMKRVNINSLNILRVR